MPSLPLIKGTRVEGQRFRDSLPINAKLVPKPESPYLTTIDGLTEFAKSSGKDRGGVYFESDQLKGHFRVSGEKLVEVVQGTNGPECTELGDIPGSDQAEIGYTLSNVVVITERKMYLYNRDDGFRAADLTNIGAPLDWAYIHSKIYYISYDAATKNTYIVQGEPNQDGVVTAHKYGTADIFPDVAYGIGEVQSDQIAVFGRHSIEFFYDDVNLAAADKFTLVPQGSRTIKKGVVGTTTKCEFMDSWAFLGGGREESISIFVISGVQAATIATAEVQEIINTYTELELRNTRMESRADNGHNFLFVHLPRHTLQYDASTGQWCQLCSGVELRPYRAINGVYDPRFGGGWLYGDAYLPVIGRLDESTFYQYGQHQIMQLTTPYQSAPNMRIVNMGLDTIPVEGKVGDKSNLFVSATQDGRTYVPQGGVMMTINTIGNYRERFYKSNIGMIKSKVGFMLEYKGEEPLTVGTELTFDVV